MDSLPNQPIHKPDQPELPFEILCRIVDNFAYEWRMFEYNITSDNELLSYTELLRLRLVSKTWSQVTTPIAFQSFRLRGSKGAQFILKNWSTSIYAPHLPCPVKRLILEDLGYLGETDETSPKELCYDAKSEPLMTMDQATKLIELIGQNLNGLTLEFLDSFGLPSNLIRAIKKIEHLKRLNLGVTPLRQPDSEGIYDPNTLADLLAAIPNLESLTINYLDLKGLELKSPVLSKVRFLSFRSLQHNLDGIVHICQVAKESLKIIEFGDERNSGQSEQVLEPLKSTLEGLITSIVTQNISGHAINMDFPKLRVLRSRCAPYFHEVQIPKLFLTWPIFHNIRTFALDIFYGPTYLRENLKWTGKSPFDSTPNLRHVIFISQYLHQRSVAAELVEFLDSHGIQCHVAPELEPDQLMELDYKLNGPVE